MVDSIMPMGDLSSTLAASMPALSAKINPNTNIDKTAQDFEAMFATQLLQPMFDSVAVDPTFGGGHGEEVMRSFMLQEYGKLIAKNGRLGIADKVKAQMLRVQEGGRTDSTSTASATNAYAKAGVQGAAHVAN